MWLLTEDVGRGLVQAGPGRPGQVWRGAEWGGSRYNELGVLPGAVWTEQAAVGRGVLTGDGEVMVEIGESMGQVHV